MKKKATIGVGISIILLLLVGGVVTGLIPLGPFTSTMQPVQIQRMDVVEDKLIVTTIATPNNKGFTLSLPTRQDVNCPADEEDCASAYVRIDDPVTVEYDQTKFYSFADVETISNTIENFPYGKSWGCALAHRTSMSYEEVSNPAQALEYIITLKDANGVIKGTYPGTIDPTTNTFDRAMTGGITYSAVGWITTGTAVPTQDFVVKNARVYKRIAFMNKYGFSWNDPTAVIAISSFTVSPTMPPATSWIYWWREYGDCNEDYGYSEIFIGPLQDKEGHVWTPLRVASPDFVEGEPYVENGKVIFDHRLPTVSGVFVVEFPMKYIGAELIVIKRNTVCEIDTVDYQADTELEPGQYQKVYVTVTNTGNHDGQCSVMVDVEGVDGSDSALIASGTSKILTINAGMNNIATQPAGKICGVLKTYPGEDTYDICFNKKLPVDPSGEVITPGEKIPTTPTLKIVGNQVMWGGEQRAKWDVSITGYKIDMIDFEWNEYVINKLQTALTSAKYTTTTENDLDAAKAQILSKVVVSSETPFSVYVAGELKAQGVNTYTHRTIWLYAPYIIGILFSMFAIWLIFRIAGKKHAPTPKKKSPKKKTTKK